MMGDCYLCCDDFTVESYGNVIPFLPMLLFGQEDLVINGPIGDEPGARESDTVCCFQTTAREARTRLDTRGIDMAFSRATYDDILPDLVQMVKKQREREERLSGEYTDVSSRQAEEDVSVRGTRSSQWGNSGLCTKPLAFEWYVDVVERIYKEKAKRSFPLRWCDHRTWSDDPEALLAADIHQASLDTESGYLFAELLFAMNARVWMEILDDDSIVKLDISDVVYEFGMDRAETEQVYASSVKLMQRQIEADYRLYGFILRSDPRVDHQLRQRIEAMSEDCFIANVLVPLLVRLGFERVRDVDFHGPGEFGRDILPFRLTTPLGTAEYYAVQAKAVDIHGTSSKRGNAGELVNQATQALNVSFVDPVDNERKRIDKFVIATSGKLTQAARVVIEESMESSRSLILLDLDSIIALVKKHQLDHYILFGIDQS